MSSPKNLSYLGHGTYGAVYRNEASSTAVIKFLYSQFLHTGQLLKEYDIGKRLTYPSLVEAQKILTINCHPTFFQEFHLKCNYSRFLLGKSSRIAIEMNRYDGTLSMLGKILVNYLTAEKGKALILRIALKMIRQVYQGCLFLKKNGYYHLDIKTTNILYKLKVPPLEITSEDEVDFSLCDYGICIALDYYNQDEYVIYSLSKIGTFCYLPLRVLEEGLNLKKVVLKFTDHQWMIAIAALEMIFQDMPFFRIFNRPSEAAHVLGVLKSDKQSEHIKRVFKFFKSEDPEYKLFKTTIRQLFTGTWDLEVNNWIVRPIFNYNLAKIDFVRMKRHLLKFFNILKVNPVILPLDIVCLAFTHFSNLYFAEKVTEDNVMTIISDVIILAICFYETTEFASKSSRKEVIIKYAQSNLDFGYNPIYMGLSEEHVYEMLNLSIREPLSFFEHFISHFEALESVPIKSEGLYFNQSRIIF